MSGLAWLGLAWLGLAWLGLAWLTALAELFGGELYAIATRVEPLPPVISAVQYACSTDNRTRNRTHVSSYRVSTIWTIRSCDQRSCDHTVDIIALELYVVGSSR
jgi:hypothetical protein